MEKKNLVVSQAPHFTNKGFFSGHTTQSIMMHVCIALIPATIAAVIFFGIPALVTVIFCIAACVLGEFLFNLAIKKPQTIKDWSAVVTGLILGLNLPYTDHPFQSWYIPVIGGLFAIVVVKMLFGGIGKNFANPAATARLFLFIAFAGTALYQVGNSLMITEVVAGSGATPLQHMSGWFSGGPDYGSFAIESMAPVSLFNMFIGNIGGVVGETSTLAILIGGVYLAVLRIIDWKIPVIFCGTVFVLVFGLTGSFDAAMVHLLGGGLAFGAVFMATDYASSPRSNIGIYIYSVGLGLITVLIRLYTSLPEGVSFAIVLMNIITPMLDKYFIHRAFGYVQPVRPAKTA